MQMINWKVRLRNKTWLLSFFPVVISAVYNILALLGIVPIITQDMVMQAITTAVNLLAVMGVLVDPTTNGISDSTRAMGYETPYKPKIAAARKKTLK